MRLQVLEAAMLSATAEVPELLPPRYRIDPLPNRVRRFIADIDEAVRRRP